MRLVARFPFALLLSASVTLPASVCAQSIRGHVTDSITGTPVGRGFIVLLAADGRELVRALTTRDGRFDVTAPGAGSYRLRSERIGYRVWESGSIPLSPRQVYSLNPVVNPLPSLLESITVTGETECQERKGPDTGLLWEEARKALVAASWSAAQEMYIHRVHRFQRDLDDSRDDVVREEITVHVVRTEMPFVSDDPADLAERGFIVPTDGNDLMWWALDANVLLDPSFHRTHCFWAVRGEGERAGLMGLAFEPAPDRRVPDVEGTLWLDQESGELGEVEFRYTNLPLRISAEHLGGRVTFLPMPSGAWILDEWRIMIPKVGWRGRRNPRITGYRDAGGQVLEVYNLDGERVYERPDLVTVRGSVYDSIQGGPLAGAIVSVDGTEYTTETDSAGRFRLRVLLEGRYRLTTSRHDWLGYRPGTHLLDFARGDTLNARFVIPSIETVHTNLCRNPIPESNLVVHGEVRVAGGGLLSGAEVVARWTPGVERKHRTGDDGTYVLCALPRDEPVFLTVRHRLLEHDPIVLRFVGQDVVLNTASGLTSYYIPDRVVRIGLEMVRQQM